MSINYKNARFQTILNKTTVLNYATTAGTIIVKSVYCANNMHHQLF